MDLSSKIELVNVSDTGLKRPHNEDSAITDPVNGLAVVADGMGGYKAGEVASGMTVASVLETVRTRLPSLRDEDTDDGHSPMASLLREALETAHTSVYQMSRSQQQCAGMGTTAVVLLFRNDCIHVASVGDSRLYRLRDYELDQITRDHSLVQELVDRGFYSPEEARNKVARNIVTRALGIHPEIQVDLIEEPAEVGDIYLLCTDGLNDLVDNEAIRLTLLQFADNLENAAAELVRQANMAGGKDNVSVVVARIDRSFAEKRSWFARVKSWL